MNDFKTRLIDERTELESNIEKLNAFLVKIKNDNTSGMSEYHLMLLHLQLNSMSSYLMCLNARVKDLKREPNLVTHPVIEELKEDIQSAIDDLKDGEHDHALELLEKALKTEK